MEIFCRDGETLAITDDQKYSPSLILHRSTSHSLSLTPLSLPTLHLHPAPTHPPSRIRSSFHHRLRQGLSQPIHIQESSYTTSAATSEQHVRSLAELMFVLEFGDDQSE